MSLETRITETGRRIQLLARRLEKAGYEFAEPDEAFPGPDPDAAEAIRQIEREAGRLPLALKLFWQRVGSVNFCGWHPDWEVQAGADWDDYTDALVVYPPLVSIYELDEFLADKVERLRCNFPFAVIVAPDALHKANVSGGAPYTISVPAVADDPPLNDEWHKTTFLNYLEEAVRWAGFPGLSRCGGQNWPIAELTKDLS